VFRKEATDVVTAGLKLAPEGPERPANDIVTVGIVFSLNDMFELEEFDSLPKIIIYHEKKCNLVFSICFLNCC
jgi:hypothetical protein